MCVYEPFVLINGIELVESNLIESFTKSFPHVNETECRKKVVVNVCCMSICALNNMGQRSFIIIVIIGCILIGIAAAANYCQLCRNHVACRPKRVSTVHRQ